MKRRRFEEPEGEIIIPVTPMLDMTFQLLIFFIVTFNPNRIVEGFWTVEVADEISTRDDKQATGAKNDQQVLSSQLNKELTYTLKVHFDENNAKSYYPRDLLDGKTIEEKDKDSPENHPRPIDAEEIDKIKDEGERNAAKEIAAKDRACFLLTLNFISADGRIGGNDITVRYDDLLKELKTRVENRRKEVIEEKAKIDNKEDREAAIQVAMNNFKIVIYGEKALRWRRFNQIRDVCYAAGFRNIQPALPEK